MGASQSIDFEVEPNNPRAWSLDQVKELEQAWKDVLNMQFGIKKEDLTTLITSCSFAEGKDFTELIDDAWSAFNPDDQNLIDTLGLICTFAVLCQGDFDAKIDFVFDTFDFNANTTISKDELTILTMASLLGMVHYVRRGTEAPSDSLCEEFSDKAFTVIDKDQGGSISRDEFHEFVASELDKDGSKSITVDELLYYFGIFGGGDAAAGAEAGVDSDLEMEGQAGADIVVGGDDDSAAGGMFDMFGMEEDAGGDEFMAVKPWIGAIKEPTEPPAANNSPPAADLVLDWVYGYRSFDTRSNLRQLATGEVVYHTAGVGVVYSKETHTQRQYFGHNDDIVSLALHPDGKTVATGEMGKRPWIHIWDATAPEGEQYITSFKIRSLQRACIHLAFSPDGESLAAVGQDDDHTLHVFKNWREGTAGGVATSETDKNKILDLAFGDDGKLVTVGVKHVKFWKVGRRSIKGNRGLFGRKGKIQPVVSATFFGGRAVTGTASGHLYSWNDDNQIEKIVKAHNRTVNTLFAQGETLYSGGKDGFVHQYGPDLDKAASVDLAEQWKKFTRPSSVRSVHATEGGELLVGCKGAEILYFADAGATAQQLAEGHFKGELWALATNPTNNTFVTAGDDQIVRVWDPEAHKAVAAAKMESFVRAASYSPDGTRIALGLGGRLGGVIPKVNGAFVVLDAETLEVVHRGQDSRRWIQDVKFSPDGGTLAVGSHDTNIYLYDVAAGFTLRATCRGHNSYITHIDWTADSAFLQSNCGAYELLFWDAATGQQDKWGATNLRDAEWASWTCVLGWPVQGIWPAYADGTDINSVDRSKSGKFVATADDFGKLKLFNYPNTAAGWISSEYGGHSSHVTNVRWCTDDNYVVSVGGNDKAVFQWTVDGDEEDDVAEEVADEEVDYGVMQELDHFSGPAPAVPDFGMDMFGMEEDAGGDEFMAVKPWIGAIKAPSEEPDVNRAEPNALMTLAWVHGYQAQASRNSLRYAENGDMVYTCAAVGVKYNRETHTQSYFRGQHTDDIISMVVSDDGKWVATGESGKRPKVFVWDAATGDVRYELKGHKRGVPQLSFSHNGRYLASVGLDNNHTVIVYDLRSGEQMWKQKGDTNKIMGIEWAPDDSHFVTVGVKHIYYWYPSPRGLKQKRGLLGSKGKRQTVLTIAFDAAGNAVAGCNNGSLYIFNGDRHLETVVDGHDRAVLCTYSGPDGFYTGGRDGKVKKWADDFSGSEDIEFEKGISSVHTKDGKVLVGTKDSQVFEVVEGESQLVFEAHHYGELWGLATHPSGEQYATVGDDKTLRVWDAASKKMLSQTQLETLSRAVAYSPDGTLIAVALGGRLGGKEPGPTGKFVVYSAETLEVVHEAHDSEQWIQDIKFSPDGATLAVASHDCKIYLYDVAGGYASKGVCSGHSSYITHIDFTADSAFLQSNCGAYELLFWDAATGEQDPSGASNLRDAEWASWTCVLGWPVQGIWPAYADGTDINSVDRSKSGSLLATADDFGRLKVFNYPCPSQGAHAVQYSGHASHVTNVRWANDDSFLITTGGNDRGIFQWANPTEATPVEDVVDSDLEHEEYPQRTDAEEAALQGFSFEMEADAGGDEFMAVKPWIGAIKEPSEPPVAVNDPPVADIQLEWVHGYRSDDTRNNLYYLASGEIVYHTASVGIVYNKETHTQRFFINHQDDIVSLALHPDGETVATGEMGKRPMIYIWNSTTMRVIKTIKGFHKRAVGVLKFSDDGNNLVSIGQDNDHSIALYDWKASSARPKKRRGRRSNANADPGLQATKGHTDKLLDAAFSADGSKVVAVGVKYVRFFDTNKLAGRSRKGLMGGVGKLQPFISAAFFNGNAVVGTASGKLYVFDDRTVAREIEAHERSVNSLFVSGDNLISGGKDGKVIVWDADFNQVEVVDVTGFDTQKGVVRSVCRGQSGNLLVGTQGAEIWEVAGGEGNKLSEAHYYGETWGLATHPSSSRAVSTGDDGYVRVWDLASHRQIAKAKLDTLVRAAAYSPDGSLIAVGLGGRLGGKEDGPTGAFRVLNAETLEVVHEAQDSEQWIQDIKFSPDGATLAVASHDCKIYLYDVAGGYASKGVCSGHSSYITHIDFTADSAFLQSNCGAYELLFWDAATGEQDPSGASNLRDAEWASWTCVLGWPVQGIWPAYADGTDINSVDRSKSGTVLATADDFGRVRLFNYPNLAAGWEHTQYMGHSSHVTNVRWSSDDSMVLSSGGNDKAVFQWKTTGMAAPVPPPDEAEEVEDDAAGMFDAFDMSAFGMEEDAGGDEFMAVKPWIGAIKAPSEEPRSDSRKPHEDYDLEWVHGYQAQTMRQSLVYTATGEIAYTCAAVGVAYDPFTHSQRFNRHAYSNVGAEDDIICMAVSKDGRHVALGERGRRPKVIVYDTRTMQTVQTLTGHRRGVPQLAFSSNGSKLTTVGLDNDHKVITYHWSSGNTMHSAKGDTNKITGVEYAPDDSSFLTVGVKHIYFWVRTTRSFKKKRGILGSRGKRQTYLTAAYSPAGNGLVGCADGSVYIFDDTKLKKIVEAHAGPLTAMFVTPTEILTGGSDNKFKVWDAALRSAKTEVEFGSGVRSVFATRDQPYLVGTNESEIVQVERATGEQKLVSEAHFAAFEHIGELWGLATHPESQSYCTVGDDRTLRTWDAVTHRQTGKVQLEGLARAAAYSPDGSLIAVGLGGRLGGKEDGPNGAFRVIDVASMEVVHAAQDSEQWIQDIKFSPDGATLAVASHDCKIYLYDVAGGYASKGVCSGHSSYITHIDFTADSAFLQSNCGAYELLFWDAATGEQDPSGASNLRDAEWASWTAVLGWPVQGIWPAAADGTDINAVDRSKSGSLLATADDFGNVKVFNYPCVNTGSQFRTLAGHSSHVTNARWTAGDGYIITTGGNDRGIFQWRLV